MNKINKIIHARCSICTNISVETHDISDSLVKKDYSTFHIDILVKQ